MSYAKIMLSAAALGLMSSAASAQYNKVVEPIPSQQKTLDQLPIEYTEAGVMKAQHIKPGDISPEEYARLLEEADKVRTYRSNSEGYSVEGYGIDVETSSSSNAVTSYEASGYEIQLFAEPVSAPVTQAATAPNTTTRMSVPVTHMHTVVKGDTLYNISKRFSVDANAIRDANDLSGNNIGIGQLLVIPTGTTTVMAETVKTVQAPIATTSVATQTIAQPVTTQTSPSGRVVRTVQPLPNPDVYAVLPKDNLYQIAKRACTSVDALVTLNGISDVTALKPGQRLQLPEGHCQK